MQTVILNVEGMSCDGCVKSVEQALKALDGVGAVNVNLAEKSVEILYNVEKQSVQTLTAAIENTGFDVVSQN